MASFDEIVSKMTAAIKGVREAVLGKDVREFIASGYESMLDAYKQLNTAVDSAASSAEKAKTAITEAIDPTLSVEGKAADAKAIGQLKEDLVLNEKYHPVSLSQLDIFSFNNLVDNAKLLKGHWIFGTGKIEEWTNTDLSDYIAVPSGKTVYLSSVYNSDGEYINISARKSCIFDNNFKPIGYTSDNIYVFTNDTSDIRYLRINFVANNVNFAIILPEGFDGTPPFYDGKVIDYKLLPKHHTPYYWEKEIEDTIKNVNKYVWENKNECYDCNVIAFITDEHIERGVGIHGELIKRLDDVLHFDSVINGGDNYTKNSDQIKFYEGQQEAVNMLSGVREKLYNIMGNHDANNLGNHYAYVAFHKNVLITSAMKRNCTFEGNALNNESLWLSYYRDDDFAKIRYLYLDNCYSYPNRFSQKDFDWITSVLESTPNGYHVAIFMHNAGSFNKYPVTVQDNFRLNGQDLFYKMLKAYNDNATIDYTDSSGKTTVSLNKNYTLTGRPVIGVFCGHLHTDLIFQSEGINVCITTSAMLNGYHFNESGKYVNDKRSKGTSEETAFDVIVINKKQKKVKLFRCGYGNDREFIY